MDTQSLFVSLNATLAAFVAAGGWLRVRGLATSSAGSGSRDGRRLHQGSRPLTLAEMLWLLFLMLAFYWFGRELGYLLLEVS